MDAAGRRPLRGPALHADLRKLARLVAVARSRRSARSARRVVPVRAFSTYGDSGTHAVHAQPRGESGGGTVSFDSPLLLLLVLLPLAWRAWEWRPASRLHAPA